jgi:spermidine synthase
LILTLPAATAPVFDAILAVHLGERYSPLAATSLLLGPPSVLLGTVSPYAIRLAARKVEKLGKASGNLYALSTVGSIVGTFVTVFVLIPEFGVNKIIVALGVTLLVVAFLGLGARMKVFVLLILIAVPFIAPYLVTHRLTVATYSLALGDTVYETDTPYHHLLVADAFDPAHSTTVRYLILDDNFHSAMDLNDPERTVFAYTGYFALPFLVNPNITRVLFIGGGGFTGPKSFLAHYPDVRVDVVEIDPEVIRVAEQFFMVDPANSRLRIYNDDGRIFLQQTNQTYDLIVLDAYSRSYVPFHLMTLEFFKLLAEHLSPDGFVVSNLIAQISGGSSQLLEAEANTMNAVFSNVYTFPVMGSTYADVQNIELLATSLTARLTQADFRRLATASSLTNNQLLDDVGNYFVLATNTAPVLTDNFAPVETLLNPLTGEPLNDQGTNVYIQETERIVAFALIAGLVLLVLRRKKFL